ncbi:MAG: hypothetical protein LBG92_02840 [Prevotellaceae bacterium]|jgi:hypothetical protein|nr:hypothetical protein [Prevotellaceae bacterium]
MKKWKLLIAAAVAVVCRLPAADGQDIDYVRRYDARIACENPAGMKHLPVSRISSAEAYVRKNSGKFVNYSQSDDSYAAGANAESFFSLNPKTVFYGSAGYSNFSGRRMGGSAFIDPDRMVFDLQETVDSTRGDKSLESYRLAGGVSVGVSSRLTLGGKIDYCAADYAKSLDLRHSNRLFDLSVSAGASYAVFDFLEIGVNYLYRRRVEGVQFKMYGTTDRRYVSLVSYGLFYGRAEQFGDSGYTDPDHQNPAVDEWNGGSLQIAFGAGDRAAFFGELSYHVRSGYYGKRSPSTPVFIEHRAPSTAYRAGVSLRCGDVHHILMAGFGRESLKNHENVYRFEHAADGHDDIVYLGNNQVFSRTSTQAGFDYTANLGVRNFCPAWVVGASANYRSRRQTVSLYPYRRRQNIGYGSFRILATRNIAVRQSQYSVSAGILYGAGSGTPKTDDVYAPPAETQRPPRNNDVLLFREYEYLTAKRAGGSLELKMRRTFVNGLDLYGKINYEFTKAFNVEYLGGSTASCAILTVGAGF